jgi:hypothetical protein
MKLRIKGNSIRLRLTQNEIQEFQEKGMVKEVVKFGNSSESEMHYIIQKTDKSEVDATFDSNKMIINIPNPIAEKWISTNQNGFENRMKINDKEDLFILVEKDFKCLQPREHEDESDMFPHPAEGTLKC